MVLLASFQRNEDAKRVIMALESCDIPCYLRNEYSNNVLGSFVDIGGYRIEIPQSSVPEALAILQASGIALPDETDSTVGAISRMADRLPILRNKPLENRLWAMLGIIVVALGLLTLILYLLSNL